MQVEISKAVVAQFWSNVDATGGPETCWPWLAGKSMGYGLFRPNGHTPERCHRIAYRLTYGAIPDGLYVCHRCDVRRCVNPAHLFLGTMQDNMADKMAKGRQAHPDHRGERHPLARLTAEQVIEIRRLRGAGESPTSVATLFGITKGHVSLVFHRRIWKHVP